MKRFFKRLICRIFGHKRYREVFAESYVAGYKHGIVKVRYNIFEHTFCERCGDYSYKLIAGGLSRAQMLKEGWFVEG